jgi:hypothetical protein
MTVETHPSPLDPALLRLPFDQYGRYRLIREALDAARPSFGRPLRALDVGGFFRTRRGEPMLPARAFLPDDDVTVLDQQPADLPGYVLGDGRGLHFDDAGFDFVVSCDTLEHVPAPDRPAFWHELLRVARYGVLLAAPFASLEVVAAEDLLFTFIKAELGFEQPQLKEHRDFGLPELAGTGALLDQLGLRYRGYPSGYVHAWLAMMLLKHSRLFDDHDAHERLDGYYTRFFGPEERREPAYRHLLAVEREDQAGWLDAVDAALAPTIRDGGDDQPGWRDLSAWIDLLLAQRRDQSASVIAASQARTIEALQGALAARETQAADLEARAHWLETQAAGLRRELEAIQRGRVMRLLRWAGRLRRGGA